MSSFKTFRFRLFLTYLAVMLFFTLVIGIPMYINLKKNIEANITSSVQQKSISTSDKLERFYQIYSSISTQIYMDTSNSDKSVVQFLDPISTDEAERHQLDQTKAIFNSLSVLTELHKEVSRISIFTASGQLFSNRDYDPGFTYERAYSQEELRKIRELKGVAFYQYKDKDPWSADSNEPIMRFVRQLRIADREIGFMEVQFPANELLQYAEERRDSATGASLYVFTPTALIYPNNVDSETRRLLDRIAVRISEASGENRHVQSLSVDHRHVEAVLSDRPAHTVVFVIPESKLFKPLKVFRNMSFGAVLLLVLVSVVVFYLLSKRLTYPLIKLRKAINSVVLGEKTPDIENDIQANEIDMLNRAFRKMNDRLQRSLEETVHFQTIQLQSQFNTLQAQINPHFLFNMLGVIKALSDRNENQTVSMVAGKLAHFLQYPLSSQSAIVSLTDEVQFVRDYLQLMKVRYMQRLEYEIVMDESAEMLQLPKLVLQPLAENSMKHGFAPGQTHLRLFIRAAVTGKQWHLTVSDNGPGFDAEKLLKLNEQIARLSEQISLNQQIDPLSIGGMGLISTFIRMRLLYKDHVAFTVNNLPHGGAVIEMSGYFINLEGR